MAELNDYLGGCGEDEEGNSNDSGAAGRWIIDSNLRWNDTFVLSGTAVSPTRRVWRLTCNPSNSVAADRSCAAEVSQDVVATVSLWADGGVGLAPCTLTFPNARLCPTAAGLASGWCRRNTTLYSHGGADQGWWVVQRVEAAAANRSSVRVRCQWANASDSIGDEWPIRLKIDDGTVPIGRGLEMAFSPPVQLRTTSNNPDVFSSPVISRPDGDLMWLQSTASNRGDGNAAVPQAWSGVATGASGFVSLSANPFRFAEGQRTWASPVNSPQASPRGQTISFANGSGWLSLEPTLRASTASSAEANATVFRRAGNNVSFGDRIRVSFSNFPGNGDGADKMVVASRAVRLPASSLLCVLVFVRAAAESRLHAFHSRDDGDRWDYAATIAQFPMPRAAAVTPQLGSFGGENVALSLSSSGATVAIEASNGLWVSASDDGVHWSTPRRIRSQEEQSPALVPHVDMLTLEIGVTILVSAFDGGQIMTAPTDLNGTKQGDLVDTDLRQLHDSLARKQYPCAPGGIVQQCPLPWASIWRFGSCRGGTGWQSLAATSNNSGVLCYDMAGCPGAPGASSIWCADFVIMLQTTTAFEDPVVVGSAATEKFWFPQLMATFGSPGRSIMMYVQNCGDTAVSCVA